ncbi:hypothetical protein JCGZ_11815 [Jatropha curcas]|uniref:Uncharacterized protein n=1 Tax=Jatropha curcas TaxID=180498 RepID=A0A067KHW6_JATCU|nr:hypothetical protein JCGZ_11815 [Jatropha curcas]
MSQLTPRSSGDCSSLRLTLASSHRRRSSYTSLSSRSGWHSAQGTAVLRSHRDSSSTSPVLSFLRRHLRHCP